MNGVDHLQSLYAYHFDITLRLVALAENLSGPQFAQQPEAGRRSIRDLLYHILDADRGWRIGLETGQRPERLRREEYLALVTLRRAFEQERAAWQELLAGLAEGQIDEEIELQAGPGRVFRFARWKVLHHVVLHGMQHHAEIAEQLTRAGASPGDIDLIFYG